MKYLFLYLISFFLFSSVHAQILPENTLKFSVDSQGSEGVSEREFKKILSDIKAEFSKDVLKQGNSLFIHALWGSDLVNAYAKKNMSARTVEVHGGIARHPLMDGDTLTLIVCHELGHHLAGLPQKTGEPIRSWMSAEAQADYFATSKCVRRLWKKGHEKNESEERPNDFIQQKCVQSFPQDSEDYQICVRVSRASMNFIYLVQDIKGENTIVNFETPDPRNVGQTILEYPSTQCRLDTLLSGSICAVSENIPFSFQNKTQGACHIKQNQKKYQGERPRCWYNQRNP